MAEERFGRGWELRHQKLEHERRLREKRSRKARRAGKQERRIPWLQKITLIQAPAELDFDGHFEQTAGFLDKIRKAGKAHRRPMFISMRRCVDMAPEVALVLAAEIERCLYHWPNTVNGNNPKSSSVTAMLRNIGFFQMLKFNEPQPSKRVQQPQLTTYLQMKAGVQGGGQHADALQRLVLGDVVEAGELVTERLIAGLNEAMLNVHQHAYPNDIENVFAPMPNGRWWIAGYRNADLHEIGFMAYDQGVGIPATLPKRRRDLVDKLVKQVGQVFSGEQPVIDHLLIQRAVEVGNSRTGLASQGHGLNDFKKLIQVAGGKGTLQILSARGSFLYSEDGREQPVPLPRPFHGTLIVWRLAASPAVVWEQK